MRFPEIPGLTSSSARSTSGGRAVGPEVFPRDGRLVQTPGMTSLNPFLEAFGADGPDPALAERLTLFGQFVGSWDLDVTNHDDDGNGVTVPGEWHFGWALAGRAVGDVWICPRRSAQTGAGAEHGASIRFFDESIDAWRSTWIGPVRAIVRPFVARPTDEGIALEGTFDGLAMRWVFSDITTTSFRWRNEERRGDRWHLNQTFAATRA